MHQQPAFPRRLCILTITTAALLISGVAWFTYAQEAVGQPDPAAAAVAAEEAKLLAEDAKAKTADETKPAAAAEAPAAEAAPVAAEEDQVKPEDVAKAVESKHETEIKPEEAIMPAEAAAPVTETTPEKPAAAVAEEPPVAPAVTDIAEPDTSLDKEAPEIDQNERIRRQELELMGEQFVAQAANHYRQGNFKEAIDNYKKAEPYLKKASVSEKRVLRRLAQVKEALFEVYADWAEATAEEANKLASTQKLDEAIEKCREAMEYDSSRREDMENQIKRYLAMKKAAEFRTTTAQSNVDVGKVTRDYDISVLFEQGKVFFNNRRYADARDAFEQILVKDPFDLRAIRYLRQISKALQEVADEKFRTTVADRIAEVRWKWNDSVTPLLAGPAGTLPGQPQKKGEADAGLRAKLQNIIIPKVEFEEASIAQVVAFLKKRSQELDPDSEGVNIILQLEVPLQTGGQPEGGLTPYEMPGMEPAGAGFGAPGGGVGAPPGGGFGTLPVGGFGAPGGGMTGAMGAPMPGGVGGMPGPAGMAGMGTGAMGAPMPGGAGGMPGTATGASFSSPAERNVTMSMNNIPLLEVIRYICMAAGLKYRVETNAVVIADKSVPLDDLETRFYSVEAGVLDTARTRQSAETLNLDSTSGDSSSSDSNSDNNNNSNNNNSSSTGTGQQSTYVAGGTGSSPTALFAFFNDFGIEFPQGSRVAYNSRTSKLVVHNTPENLRKIEKVLSEINVTPTQVTIEAKFVEVNQDELNSLGFQWLLETGDGMYGDGLVLNKGSAKSPNIQVLKQGGTLSNSILTAGLRTATTIADTGAASAEILELNSILGTMAFNTVITALSQLSDSNTLSAPKVTALSGNTAILRMVEERYFPESWTEPEVTAATTTSGASFKPSIPEFGDARDIGVILEVTPTVAADGYSIDLDLRPQVTDFVGYEDFSYNQVIGGATVPAVVKMAKIAARTVETKVIIWDGETVVLGGMIREEVIRYNDKVPVLGDVPLIGRLFQSKGERNKKVNLLIFVTARLVNPSGVPIRANELRGLPDFRR